MHHTSEWRRKNKRHRRQVTFNLVVIPLVLAHLKICFLWLKEGAPLAFNLEGTIITILVGWLAYQTLKVRELMRIVKFWHERICGFLVGNQSDELSDYVHKTQQFWEETDGIFVPQTFSEPKDLQSSIEHDINLIDRSVGL